MKWILNGFEVTPRNVFDISLDSDWTGRPTELEAGTDSLKIPREGLDVIQSWISQYGPFQGIPLQCILNNGQVVEYYVDLMDGAIYEDFDITVKIKRRKGRDSFFTQADGTSFELMASKGVNFNVFNVPYIIVKDNAVELALTMSISLYVMTRELIDQIIALSESITNIIDAVTLNATVPPSVNTGPIITLVIKALVQLAVIALLIVALIKMSEQFFELLFPKIRNFLATKVQKLIAIGCAYLGYTLESNLLQENANLTLLPVPLVKDKDSFWDFIENDLNFAFTKGYPSGQDSTPTLGSLISFVETMYNAKTRVINGIVQIERRDYWAGITQNQFIPALNIQGERRNNYTFNTDESWKRTYISFDVDPSDTHTMDFFDPTDAEYSTEVSNIANEDLVLIKGLNSIKGNFAYGVRKNKLNWLEKFAKEFFEVVDEVIEAFGGNGNFASQITNRIGVLQISQQFYSKTKIMWTIGGKQPENYQNYIGASAIYNKYHVINEIQNNDYKVYQDVPVRMTNDEFSAILNNNFVTFDGKVCEILTMQYLEDKRLATVSYKEPFDYADGKVYTLTINT
tara:strand:+ start:3047 stop:4762 length:1716 start_codon:yes stop_codon:yes gene_type:complete